MAIPRVVTVVLNWNHPDETLVCVRSLLTADYPNQHVVVIDNSAGNSGIEQLLSDLNVEIIRNADNLGFTGAANVGMLDAPRAGADYVWLVNSDAIVPPDTLTKLVATAQTDAYIGLVSPVIYSPEPPQNPVVCLGVYSSRVLMTTASIDQAQEWLRCRPKEVFVYGTALLIRRSLIEAIGVLDDQFFAYFEDLDYCIRCHEAGFRVTACLEAAVYHHFKSVGQGEGAPPHLAYFMTRNYLLLLRKRSFTDVVRKSTLWFFL